MIPVVIDGAKAEAFVGVPRGIVSFDLRVSNRGASGNRYFHLVREQCARIAAIATRRLRAYVDGKRTV